MAERGGIPDSEVTPAEFVWHRSSISQDTGAECLEMARTSEGVLVRDSKNQAGPTLRFSPRAWASFLADCGTAD
ncbi:hypothetical protein GCM10010174_35550 [Kutzneria viridogrisea]|uniref:DUF397 domain-containing protein n=1 Tax=Kutzneria viridogrisea TaxID=47990 RepID=A0ABR6BLI6_9PSEU|nr:hypothetical protein [Kutzneria viridogrisea]